MADDTKARHVRGKDAHAVAFPTLTERQIARFAEAGEATTADDGDVLVEAGEREYPLLIVRRGRVRIVERREDREDVAIADHGPGEFVGDVDLLTGRPAVFTAIAEGECELVRVPRQEVRGVVAGDPSLGETMLRALLVRRDILGDTGFAGARLVGSRWSKRTQALRELMDRNAVPYTWLDPERDEGADGLLRSLGVEPGGLPILLTSGGVLRQPTNEEAADALGLRGRGGNGEKVRDLLILGAGPAGLAAAVYAGSEGLDVLVADASAPGGQAGTSSKIENYPGFPTGVSGGELARRTAVQAQKFGAEIRVPCRATGLKCEGGGHKRVEFDGGDVVTARAVLIATGARYRRLGLDGEDDFAGTGVYYGATQMEATMCAGRTVAVVGGGNSAGQAAMFLSERTERVLMLVRGGSLASSMSRYLIERLEAAENVDLLYGTRATALHGDAESGRLDRVTLATGDGEAEREVGGLFVMIGADPCTGWLKGSIALDDHGFVLTGRDAGEGVEYLATSCPGVLAAGDVRSGSIKRVATAVGEGAMAVRFVHDALAM